MRTDDPPLCDLLTRQSHVITRAQALERLTRRTVEHRLRSRRWQTAHHGVYVAHSGPIGPDERRWTAVLGTVRGRSAWLGGLSALETVGFRGFPTPVVHVLLPARVTAKRPPPGVAVHRTTRLPPSDLHLLGRPPGTMPARSLIDAAQWQSSARQAAAIVMAGFQQRLVCAEDITGVLAAMSRIRHHAVISEAIGDATDGAQSLPEAAFLRLCRTAGLPEPQMQHPRHDALGRRHYLDAYFPDHGVHVDIDGSHHIDVRQWWDDMRRQNNLWLPASGCSASRHGRYATGPRR